MAVRRARLIPALLATAALAPAQRVISAESGLVYTVRGRVSIEGSGLLPMGNKLRQLKAGEILFAERGRAEVLLNPATVLRLGNMSRLRMDDLELSDPCVTLLSGSAVISIAELPKGRLPKEDRIEVHATGGIVVLSHPGEYRFDASPSAGLRVYDGKAEVIGGAVPVMVRRGRSVDFARFEIAKFDPRSADSLERWAHSSTPPPPRSALSLLPPPLSLASQGSPPPNPQPTMPSH